MSDTMIELCLINKNHPFIISTCLRYVDNTDFVKFFEDYNRYKVEIFRVNKTYKGLSNNI